MRILLASVLLTAAGPALAEGDYLSAPSVSPAWSEASCSRAPGVDVSRRDNPVQAFLLRSGATGGGGQGS